MATKSWDRSKVFHSKALYEKYGYKKGSGQNVTRRKVTAFSREMYEKYGLECMTRWIRRNMKDWKI